MFSLRATRLFKKKTFVRQIGHSVPSRRALPLSPNAKTLSDEHELDSSRFLRMLMFGKPGAGKGTLSARLVDKYDILSLSSGDLLRKHIAERTEVGREAEETVARGGLLPDQIMLKVVTSNLDSLHNKHWILDGFPRTLGQAKLLDQHLEKKNVPLTFVVNINVPDDIILSRISDRWVHLPSGRVYNMSYNPPKVEGYDDITGEPLIKRPDDNPDVFSRRLAQFYTSTSPLLDYYTQLAESTTIPAQNPHQHPHQLTLHRPQKVMLKTLSGATSDENWPVLDRAVRFAFPALKERSSLRDRRRSDLNDTTRINQFGASLQT